MAAGQPSDRRRKLDDSRPTVNRPRLTRGFAQFVAHDVPQRTHELLPRIVALQRELVAVQADLHRQRERVRAATHRPVEPDQAATGDRILDSAVRQLSLRHI